MASQNRRLGIDVITTGDTSGLAKTAAALEATVESIDDVGDEARQAARKVEELKEELTQLGYRRLSDIFDVDLGRFGRDAGQQFSNAFGRGITKIPPDIVASIVAPITPAIGAAASAGILLGVGGGAIAVGIAAATRSQAVTQAWAELAAEADTQLSKVGGRFESSVVDALGTLRGALANLNLADVLTPAARAIGPLAAGISGLITNALPGLKVAIEAATAPLETLADELPEVGTALSEMFEAVSYGGEGSAVMLRDTLHLVEALGTGTATVVGGMGKLYETADKFGMTGLFQQVEKLVGGGNTGKLVELGDKGSASVSKLGGAAEATAGSLAKVNQEIDEASKVAIDWAQAEIGAENSIRSATKALNESSGSLDVHTAKGAAARDAVIGMAEASNRAVVAKFAETGSVEAAMAVYDGYRAQLIQTMVTAGTARWEAEALANAWLRVPPVVATQYRVTTTYTQVGTPPKTLGYGDIPTGRIGGFAGGGWTKPGPIVVGEKGPELMWEEKPRYVSTAAETARMLSDARAARPSPLAPLGSGGGGSGVVTLVLRSGGSRLDDLLVEIIRASVDRDGGSVQAYLGRPGVTV